MPIGKGGGNPKLLSRAFLGDNRTFPFGEWKVVRALYFPAEAMSPNLMHGSEVQRAGGLDLASRVPHHRK